MKLTLKNIFQHSNEAERVKTRLHSSIVDPDPQNDTHNKFYFVTHILAPRDLEKNAVLDIFRLFYFIFHF